jgi:hypothetical protein
VCPKLCCMGSPRFSGSTSGVGWWQVYHDNLWACTLSWVFPSGDKWIPVCTAFKKCCLKCANLDAEQAWFSRQGRVCSVKHGRLCEPVVWWDSCALICANGASGEEVGDGTRRYAPPALVVLVCGPTGVKSMSGWKLPIWGWQKQLWRRQIPFGHKRLLHRKVLGNFWVPIRVQCVDSCGPFKAILCWWKPLFQ